MIRKAKLHDVDAIHSLLQHYAVKGELLPRPLSALYDHVRSFSVSVDERKNLIVGCCALQFCWEDLAEIRSLAVHPDYQGKKIGSELTKTVLSLAVHPDYQGKKIGSELTKTVLSEAKDFDTKKVFTLTYKPDFFRKFGFAQIDRSDLPIKIWADCITCVKFPDCDETAMMKEI
ncbi:MAG: GNAT family N-acetyltransferase [Deltaproteobacteria bacterium]|nr:GNAT family N-acetyltransferase [Deltaproteobacteria bacterium]